MSSNCHDDLLFFVILLVGFHALMCLGELVWPDKKGLQDFRKVTKRDSVELLPEGFSFFPPGHKANKFFEGNKVIVQRNSSGNDPDEPFRKYLQSQDRLFPFHPQLWLQADGSPIVYTSTSLPMLPVIPCVLVALLHSLKQEYPLTSSKQLAVGPPTLFTFIFVTIPCSSLLYFLAIGL